MRLWVKLWVGAFQQVGSNLLEDMVGPGGLEPLTSSVSRKRSNQLSYGPTVWKSVRQLRFYRTFDLVHNLVHNRVKFRSDG